MQLILISHEVENTLIYQRASDGYVNATAMCKASGKQIFDYLRLSSTKEFLQELSNETQTTVSSLIISVTTGANDLRGTWVHPDVAVNLGQWCSPKFAVAVSRWVREWVSGKSKSQGLPYHIQRYIANQNGVPVTHFSMLNEMIFALLAPLENAGYAIPDHMIPDISMGKMFCKWLRDEKDMATKDLPVYKHQYEDGRVVPAKLYPNSLLPDFRTYFHNTWLPLKAEDYFKKRDERALLYLPRLLPSLEVDRSKAFES